MVRKACSVSASRQFQEVYDSVQRHDVLERRKIMPEKIPHFVRICAVVGLAVVLNSAALADWSETFGGNAFDQVWTWGCYPDVTGTFTHVIIDGPGDDDYLSMDETTKFDTGAGSYGSAFGIGFCTQEAFADVRVGTVVNVAADAAIFYHGIGRATLSITVRYRACPASLPTPT